MGEKNVYRNYIEDDGTEYRNRDYLGQAKEAYKCGEYDSAWILASKAMLLGGRDDAGIAGECMLVGMVQNGAWRLDLDKIKEEPKISVEGDKARTTVYVENKIGICETTAAILVGTAKNFQSAIEFIARGKKVDAKSILLVEALGLMKGTKLDIQAEGKDAEEAVRNLGKLILNRFGEE